MFARVSRYRGDAERLRDGFESVSPELEDMDGFNKAYFLSDSDTGRALSITLWDTLEAMDASAERAHAMRTRASEPADATVVSVENYELTLTVEGRTPLSLMAVLAVGERVEVESESVNQTPRRGVIARVLREEPSPRYQIRWDDGHESILSPSSGALGRARN